MNRIILSIYIYIGLCINKRYNVQTNNTKHSNLKNGQEIKPKKKNHQYSFSLYFFGKITKNIN